MKRKFQLKAGNGIALGAILAALIALLVNAITGDTSVWVWAIPVGVAAGPLPAKEIQNLYRNAGLARRTVFRAKRQLGVRSFRPPGKSGWH